MRRAGMADLYCVRVAVPPYERDDSEIAYEQIAAHLSARIRAGEFPPGAKLPTDDELAVQYQVSVETGRKAAKLLKERGLIKITRSKGKFVLRETKRHPEAALDPEQHE